MRAFIGISLPDEARRSLAALQQELEQSRADVKWVEPEQLHVTLKFLDEISDAQQSQIAQFLSRLAQQQPTFSIDLKAIGAFPSLNNPRILWVGVGEGTSQVIRLAGAIEEEARACSLRQEERPYSAHVTIGRVRSARHLQELIQQLSAVSWQPPTPWQVASLTFYHSVLSSAGPAYAVLAEVPLA